MAVEIGVFRLIREARYTFVLRSQQLPQNGRHLDPVHMIFSSHRTRELYELLWELEIDVSIIYSF